MKMLSGLVDTAGAKSIAPWTAAIACLHRVSYAATATQLVMEGAGVSGGAMLHHFPNKVDLIIAVAEAAAHQNRYVRRRLGAISPGMDRYLAITEATWEAMCEPPAIALIEITIASRSDPALGERFPAIAAEFEATQREGVWEMARELGVRDQNAIERMVRLHRAAMRGLAIEMLFTGDSAAAEGGMELLEWYKQYLTGNLLTRGGEPLFRAPKAP